MSKENLGIWEDIFCKNEWGKYPYVALIKFVARNFYRMPNRKDIKILELGSGPGANLWYMAREGFTVYGIDGSPTACDRAKQRLETENLSCQIGQIKAGDYCDLLDDFEDEYFDAIVDIESLYCNPFDKSREIIIKAFKKLKSGGGMFSLTFADGTWGLDCEEVDYHGVVPVEGPMANTGFGRYVTEPDIEKLYKLENNNIISIERQDLHLANKKVIKEWIIELRKV